MKVKFQAAINNNDRSGGGAHPAIAPVAFSPKDCGSASFD